MPYWQAYYHLVWATKNREPTIDADRAATIDHALRAAARERGAVVHAVGVMPDHVHVAVSIPPRLAAADLVQALKGGTSHLLNHGPLRRPDAPFAWQAEYGLLTFGKRSLPDIVHYVTDQEAHHASDNLWPTFEHTERRSRPLLEVDASVRSPGRASSA